MPKNPQKTIAIVVSRAAAVVKSNIDMNCNTESIWLKYQHRVKQFAINQKVQPEDANDIAQEVYLRLHKFCSSRTGIKNMGAWLNRVTNNVVADYYRMKNKMVLTEDAVLWHQPDELEPTLEKEAASYIQPLLNYLPTNYSEPLRLEMLSGLKQDEIAGKLNIGHGTLRTRLARARKMLKKKILECAELETDSTGRISDFFIKSSCNSPQHFN
jgi:RNA polymerase sigma-70 factor (ECF subfamily)